MLGKIYIRTEVQMQAKHLEIKVKGSEKCSFLHDDVIFDEFGNEVIIRVREKKQRRLLDFNGICFTFKGPLAPGDYTIPYDFTLPPKLSGSCYINKKFSDYDEPKAIVQYTVRAKLVTY